MAAVAAAAKSDTPSQTQSMATAMASEHATPQSSAAKGAKGDAKRKQNNELGGEGSGGGGRGQKRKKKEVFINSNYRNYYSYRDHHCIWINNCVGHENYKIFLVFVLYAVIASFYSMVLIIGGLVHSLPKDEQPGCDSSRTSIVDKIVKTLNEGQLPPPDVVEVVVSPPYVFLHVVKSQLRPEFQVAAQNCWVKKGGAFTGEVSAEMLVNLGIPWVILGHSERRSLLEESSEALVFWSESLNCLLWNMDAKRSKGEEKLLVRESLSQGSALTYKRSRVPKLEPKPYDVLEQQVDKING